MKREEREEAKSLLERHKEEFGHDFGWDISTIHALDLAIEVLSTESTDIQGSEG